MQHGLIICIGLAVALMGEPLAAAFLLLGFEVGLALGKPTPERKKIEEPGCIGTYPFLNLQEQAERDCWHCPFEQECFDQTPHPMPRSYKRRKRRNA